MSSTTAATRKIPLLDLKALHEPLREEILAELARVFDSQSFILGPDVKELEKDLAAYCQVPYVCGCASGTDALILALMAAGVGPGDRVLTTPFSFFATASSIARLGAIPVFADIDPRTFNLDPQSAAEVLARTPDVKAMIPVHLFGGAADMDPLLALARPRGIFVVEDAAQAIGAEYKGRRVLSLGDSGCLSFFPSKNLGGIGDGGAVTALDRGIAHKLAALRVHGSIRKYFHDWVGLNSRLDTLQAAVLRVKLRYLDRETAGRQVNAARWRELLAGGPARTEPPAPYQTRHVYNQFVIRVPGPGRRDALKAHLEHHGIGTEIYYPLSLHEQACFQHLGYRAGDFPESERAAREVLAIPVHSALEPADLEHIAGLINRF